MKYAKYELIMKKSKVHDSKYDYRITDSSDVYKFATKIMRMHEMPEEHFCIITCDVKGNIIGYYEVSKGDLSSSPVHPREVYKLAIAQNAAALICLHNHPSGDSHPSSQDIDVTRRLKDAGDLLGIVLHDHIIIGDNEFFSMRAQNYLN